EWSIYDIYLDEGISGKNITARPAMTRMVEDIKAGQVKNVLVFKIDRLTRSTADLVYLIDLFKDCDCAFNSLMESIDTSTASGRMFIKIIGIFAEFERENIAERVRVGFERRAREGYTTSSKCVSYGYSRTKGQKIQIINEEEAKNVRMIFDMYVNQGMSLRGIAKSLNLREIPTKKNAFWTSSTIQEILRNCNYMGNVRYGIREPNRNFETAGLHEAIISEALYNEAQILMEKNGRISPTKQPKEQNYFTGFVYCDKCGERLLSHNSITKNKNGTVCKIFSFYCRRRIMNVCDSKGVTAKKIERALLEYFSRVEDFTVLDVVELAQKRQQMRQDLKTQIDTFNEKIKKLDGKEREVMSLYIDGEIEFKNYREMKKQLDGDRDFIRAEIVKLKITLDEKEEPSISKADVVVNFRENWEHLTDLEKRQFLTKFIKKIVLVNEPIEGAKQGHTVITRVEFCGE
ncbi:MAG: recombinase family protein, partial [Chitinispirillales bacterium]|nr:recombinase family protein [Chitinispirillales bacterium]